MTNTELKNLYNKKVNKILQATVEDILNNLDVIVSFINISKKIKGINCSPKVLGDIIHKRIKSKTHQLDKQKGYLDFNRNTDIMTVLEDEKVLNTFKNKYKNRKGLDDWLDAFKANMYYHINRSDEHYRS